MLDLTFGQTPGAPLVLENEWNQADLMMNRNNKEKYVAPTYLKFLELQCCSSIRDWYEPLFVKQYVPALWMDYYTGAQMNQPVHEQGGTEDNAQMFLPCLGAGHATHILQRDLFLMLTYHQLPD